MRCFRQTVWVSRFCCWSPAKTSWCGSHFCNKRIGNGKVQLESNLSVRFMALFYHRTTINHFVSLRFVSSWSGFNLLISSLNDVREVTLAAKSWVIFSLSMILSNPFLPHENTWYKDFGSRSHITYWSYWDPCELCWVRTSAVRIGIWVRHWKLFCVCFYTFDLTFHLKFPWW